MSPRAPLPPPPPPAEIRSWPDREALLADRARALDALGRRLLGGGRFALFAGTVLLLQLGWGMVGVTLVGLGTGAILDPITFFVGLVVSVLGAGVMVPGLWLAVRGVRQDRLARERLAAWAALDRDRAADARLRRPVPSALWMVVSAVLCGLGLWLGFAVPAGADPADGRGPVAYGMGVALIFWINGLIGLSKAVGHYRRAIRTAPAGRAGRSASSGPPRHG
ncbi:hypothetical protein ACFFSH_10435 [Streptomyces filamentosus]|uniref:Uncharacterized protein n=1 Tax=Streptomyces filamentosus TaxID=67294 RepID=A0A919EKA5_STRFL|nr:hypothetical protein [Streptomyces filamentosus]KAA6219206.1 hypothetical protein CP979_21715 [Streptomyces filamentosus]GHF88853.1 hypothetical protein GCM10017667_17020 [Streptomyces filamentosus]